MTTAKEILDLLQAMSDKRQAQQLMRFFKTGKGQYGEGDHFLGIRVPDVRKIVKEARNDVTADEISKLILSPWHESRLCGFLFLVEEMKSALPKRGVDTEELRLKRKRIADFYLNNSFQANNWDLVDLSCPKILGVMMLYPAPGGDMPSSEILYRLSESVNLWQQRIAIVTTWMLIRAGRYEETLSIAERYLSHPHDLIHKATGWMLREVGKRNVELLRDFLNGYSLQMPRTMLRYAIEKLPEEERKEWLRR